MSIFCSVAAISKKRSGKTIDRNGCPFFRTNQEATAAIAVDGAKRSA
jgi:hypothetical protein